MKNFKGKIVLLILFIVIIFTSCYTSYTGKEKKAIDTVKCRIGKEEWQTREFDVTSVKNVGETYYVHYTFLNDYGTKTIGEYGITMFREPCW